MKENLFKQLKHAHRSAREFRKNIKEKPHLLISSGLRLWYWAGHIDALRNQIVSVLNLREDRRYRSVQSNEMEIFL